MQAQMSKLMRTMRDFRAAQKRIDELDAQLRELSAAYYNDSESPLSDDAFDAMMDDLENLEQTFPELARADSVTQTVGAEPPLYRRINHVRRILSLRSVKSLAAVDDFWRLMRAPLIVEEKIDGLTAVITYRNGKLQTIATRGNGHSGTDVTAFADMVAGLPKALPEDVVIRAEVYCTYDSFKELNRLRKCQGMPGFMTCRSAASRVMQSGEAPANILDYKVIELVDGLKMKSPPKEHCEFRRQCLQWGMPIATGRVATTLEDLRMCIKLIDAARERACYPTDGLVIKLCDYYQRQGFGEMSSGPRWAVALKKTKFSRRWE